MSTLVCTLCSVHSSAQTIQLMIFMCLNVMIEINLSKFEPWLV
jgi:hypothetical protein